MNPTKIEWCDRVSNPVRARRTSDGQVGWACTKCATGCQHCYAETLNRRFGTGERYTQEAIDSGRVEFWLDEAELRKILRSRATGESVFVGDMTDLWHPNVPGEWVDRIVAACALRPDLDFCFLTKRPERMAAYFAGGQEAHAALRVCGEMGDLTVRAGWPRPKREALAQRLEKEYLFPLPNVYLGMSASNQPDLDLDAGISHLMQLGAAGWKTALSLEPLLGPVDVGRCLNCWCPYCGHDEGDVGERCTFCGKKTPAWLPICVAQGGLYNPDRDTWHSPIDAVIVGGETGPGARPMHPDWVRAIRDQCAAAGVPFFFKSWGEWGRGHDCKTRADMVRLGRKRTGRTVDGVIHDATPWHLKKRAGPEG